MLFENSIKSGTLQMIQPFIDKVNFSHLLRLFYHRIKTKFVLGSKQQICHKLEKKNCMLFSRLSSNMASSSFDLQIRGNRISFVETFKLLGEKIDRELKFDEHVTNICKKVNQKSDIISKNGYLFSTKFK